MRRGRVFRLALLAGALLPLHAEAQDTARVVVQYIAGANLYLGGGTLAGIRTGDTLSARKVRDGSTVGSLLVIASTEDRSVVSFLSAPYSLTRGDTLSVSIAHATVTAAAQPAAVVPVAMGVAPRPRPVRTSSGSLSLDLDLMRTQTTGVGSDPQVVDRTFTTPSLGLQYRAQGAPGAFEFRTSLRATQRSSSDGLVDPATLVQVYEAALIRRTPRSEIQVGRFYSPYESFSGYWDGALLHRGTEALGIGVLAGFEPDRGNSGFQSREPKVGAVVHGRTRGTGVRYRSELAVNVFFPKQAPTTHVMTGWAQALQAGALLASHSLQLDRETLTGHWVVTRLLTRLAARVGTGGTVYAGYAIRQPYLDRTVEGVIPFRRDQWNGGVSYWSSGLGVAFDVSRNQQAGLSSQMAYSGALSLRPSDPKGFGYGLNATHWSDPDASGTLLSPSLSRRLGATDLTLDYQYYRSEVAGTSSLSHALELGGRVPLGARSQFSFRLRERSGAHLQSSGLYAGVWYPF